MTLSEIDSMNIIALKKLGRDLGIKNISKYRKAELIELIKKTLPASVEKDGTVLTEKISCKDVKSSTINNNIPEEKQGLLKHEDKELHENKELHEEAENSGSQCTQPKDDRNDNAGTNSSLEDKKKNSRKW